MAVASRSFHAFRRGSLLALLLAGVLAGCSQRGGEALSLLDTMSGSQRPDAPEIRRQTRTLDADGTDYVVDLYRRTDGQVRASLLLVPGVTPEGRDDPRLVEFAELLAQARFAVTVPELPNLRELRVSAEDAESIGDLLARLASESRAERPLGLAAISYAAGPALLAASSAPPWEAPDFMLAVGGYYDTENVVRYFTTGAFREPGETDWRQGDPHPQARWLFLRANADRLENPADRRALQRIATRRMKDPQADTSLQKRRLTREGRDVLALLENRDPDAVSARIAELPAFLRRELADLSLAGKDLGTVDFPVLLLHGRDDPVIPYSESLRLAEALPEGTAEVTLTEGLMHVEMADSRISDGIRLYDLTVRLLELRDGLP
ncbi:hypothetical protein ACFOW6_01315 [Fodinicurvata halophila]|uniref:Alpha/beta hydrolase n=1 Tax=Fodinicurvata halophila TaxID=1419723 RepID=A0ABV8UIA2_9PROT